MPLILELSPEAAELFDDWHLQLELRLDRNGTLRPVAEWVSKVVGSVTRVAGLLQVAEGQDRQAISEDVMRRAIRVGDYWIRQASGLTTGLWEGFTVDVPRCERVLRWVRNSGQKGAVVSVAALRRGMKWTTEEAEDIICDLEAHKWLIIAPVERTGLRGRPKSPELRFHPSLWISANTALSAKSADPLSLSLSLNTPPIEGGADLQKIVSPDDEGSEPEDSDPEGDGGYSLF
jgi:hypothetical protein